MPSYIIKPEREQDFYVMWSTIVEAPTGWGSRAELTEDQWWDTSEMSPERFARVDEFGTSCLETGREGYRSYGYEDPYSMIYMQRGLLRRDRLRQACQRLAADPMDRITDLLEPLR